MPSQLDSRPCSSQQKAGSAPMHTHPAALWSRGPGARLATPGPQLHQPPAHPVLPSTVVSDGRPAKHGCALPGQMTANGRPGWNRTEGAAANTLLAVPLRPVSSRLQIGDLQAWAGIMAAFIQILRTSAWSQGLSIPEALLAVALPAVSVLPGSSQRAWEGAARFADPRGGLLPQTWSVGSQRLSPQLGGLQRAPTQLLPAVHQTVVDLECIGLRQSGSEAAGAWKAGARGFIAPFW